MNLGRAAFACFQETAAALGNIVHDCRQKLGSDSLGEQSNENVKQNLLDSIKKRRHCSFPDAATCFEICNQPSESVCDLCLYNMQRDPVAGAGGGCHQGGNVGDFMRFIFPPTHTSNAIVASARGVDPRAQFHYWQESRSADITNFFICAESIRRTIMKYRINTCGNHSLIIFQGSCLEKSHLMNCHEILNRH